MEGLELVEELEIVVLSLEDCIEFFVTGITYGLIMSGVCFFVGLAISQCLKLIKSA